jgi:hypothetical protein
LREVIDQGGLERRGTISKGVPVALAGQSIEHRQPEPITFAVIALVSG